MQLQLQVRTLLRDLAHLDDDAVGTALVELVRQAVAKESAPAVAAVTRPDRLEVIGLKPIVENKIPLQGFLASLTTAQVEPVQEGPVAVGLMGTVQMRRNPKEPGVPLAVVFLEWSDCRWWQWRGLVDPESSTIRVDTETITRAIDGDPVPNGLGRWWSLARRQHLKVKLVKQEPMVH